MLSRMSRQGGDNDPEAVRARFIIGASRGNSDADIAREQEWTRAVVGKWRRRFLAGRVDGLRTTKAPRPTRQVPAALRSAILSLGAGSALNGHRLSTRAIARALGTSQSTVSRILRKRIEVD